MKPSPNSSSLNIDYLWSENYDDFPDCTLPEFSLIFENFFLKFKSKIDKLELHPFSSIHNGKTTIGGIIHVTVELGEITVLCSFDMKTINILSNDIKDKTLCDELVKFFQEEGRNTIKSRQHL